MRERNYLLALVLLALFAACGVWYFRAYVEPPKPFGIILFVGEGIVTGKLAAARLYEGGPEHRLAIDGLPHVAILSARAADSFVPDAAAAASALACGTRVNLRALSVDAGGRPLATLLEIAAARNRATGIVTNGALTDPALAAFYAHAADNRDREALAALLFGAGAPDVILGGGGGDFLPTGKGGRRHDAQDFVQAATERRVPYSLLQTNTDLQAVQPWRAARLLGIFGADALAYPDQLPPGNTQPSLTEMVIAAVETLEQQKNGYLLVVDAGLVERASLENQSERVLQELVELDHAVGAAVRYAGPQSLVIAAGSEETGGMALNGRPPGQDRGAALLAAPNPPGSPAVTWSTGPDGPGGSPSPAAGGPAAFYSPQAANTADDAVAAGSGPGSEALQGFKENTFVFELIRSQL